LTPVRAAGIAVDFPSRGRPTARLVVMIDSAAGPTVEGHEAFTSDDVDLATQLHDMAEAVRSRLTGVGVDRALVRRADQPPQASKKEGPRLRLLAEGAVISAARSVVVDTRVGTGRDTGAWYGSNKATLDADAKQVANGHRLARAYEEATAAALAALALG
jgi:hypothetical protein